MGNTISKRTPGYNPGAFGTYDANALPMFSQPQPGQRPGSMYPTATGVEPYQGLDPSQFAAWAQLEGLAPEKERITRQLALADKLRAGAPALMQSQSKINTPNWAGALASMFQNYQAGQYDQLANTAAGDYATKRGKIIQQYFNKKPGAGSGMPPVDPLTTSPED